ncbi:sensor domain-containing diguanylate cyclase [Pseudomonas cremoricolorata]|uniref:sensor domain-containing diguanylate cyclase n=1 Tax=Pseudomonas cremoricolorata TaxID=157783 RepID=UPI000490D9CD|nr:sensor domain-containing diguanylate cyclase [Pseudomonas cremoricolorata]
MPSPSALFAVFKSRPELSLSLGSCLAVLAIVSIVGYLLARERDGVEQAAIRGSNNIVQLIESDILRNVELYDQSLRGVIWGVKHPELLRLPPELRQQILFSQAFTTPVRGDILWLDGNGEVRGDSTSSTPRQANFADTAPFQTHQRQPGLGLLISPPFKARLGDLDWCISFTRRISGEHGEFLGIAAGALRLSYFDELFKRLDVGEDSSVNLFNLDGQLLARQPVRPGDPQVGSNYGARPNFQRIISEHNGSFIAPSAERNGERRMYTFAKVADLPLIVLVVHSVDEVFAPWRRTAMLVGGATGVLCVAILWLSLLLGRELRRRQVAEQNLEALAATDGLTGLANRRRLDQVLRQEWARAQRNAQPLAVLMIDVDDFKAFNQRHGHAGGDHALREVALTLQRCIRRPADLAARYGGEEFQVVLPETDLAGAYWLAERIRQAVAALPPFGGDSTPVTVSIGIAVHTAQTQQDLTTLLGLADEALYRAKAAGRNRVEGALA